MSDPKHISPAAIVKDGTILPAPTRASRVRKPGSPESVAVRRICRILDDLEEPKRVRVVGALRSIYFGPEQLA